MPRRSAETKIIDWQRKQIANLGGGINSAVRPEDIQDTECTDVLNCQYIQGMLRVDTGYSTFGQAINGIAQGAFQVFKTDGSSELVLATTSTFYKWNTTFLEWDFVDDSHSTTLTANNNAGDTVINVSSVANWAVNDWIGVSLADGSQLPTQISAINSLAVTITNPIPSGKTATSGATVVHAPVLAGTIDEQVVFVTFPGNNWLVFTNGIDNVKYYDNGVLQNVPNLPTNTSCRTLNIFHEMLLLGDTTENGTRFPQRVRRSNAGDPTNWTTGTAGTDDLLDTEDFILSFNPLGPWLIIYRETSIMKCSYLGLLDQTFFFEYMIEGEGAISKGSVAETGGSHVFVGNAGIYNYYGGYDLESIGDNVFYKTLAITGNINPSYKNQLFSFYVSELDEVWIFYTCGSCTVPGTMLRVVLENNAWFVRKFGNSMIGYGFYINTLNRVWSSLAGNWTYQTYSWDSKVQLANAPATLLCDAVTGQVYSYDYTSIGDNIYYIPWTYTTKDFGLRDYLVRHNALILYGRGNSILIEMSIDQGQSWIELATVNFGTTFSRQKIFKQAITDFARYRFSGTDPNSAITWFEIEFMPESV